MIESIGKLSISFRKKKRRKTSFWKWIKLITMLRSILGMFGSKGLRRKSSERRRKTEGIRKGGKASWKKDWNMGNLWKIYFYQSGRKKKSATIHQFKSINLKKTKVSRGLLKNPACCQKLNQPKTGHKIRRCIDRHQFLGLKTQRKKEVPSILETSRSNSLTLMMKRKKDCVKLDSNSWEKRQMKDLRN